MKMDIVAGSGNDEFYTPPYAIEPIKKYLAPFRRIWCPFDMASSEFVRRLWGEHDIIATHIRNGQDFFETEVVCDAIVSNPPYSLKTQVLERLFKLGKPFAMLLGVVGLFESQRRFEMFRDNDFEIMYLNKRVSYYKEGDGDKPSLNPPFSSVCLCSKILPQKIMFEEIVKN